jgi:hypothetical protein
MIKWRKIVTYRAVYVNPKSGNTITVRALNPLPKHRAFRGPGGNRKYKRTQYTATRRVVLIMAKSRKKGRSTKDDVVDDELDELEELEDLDDLEDEEDDDEDDGDEPDDEEEDEDDDDEDEDEEDELSDMTVKELRAKAREDGHAAAAIKGLKKDELIDLINEGVEEEDEEDEDDDDDEEEEEAPRKRRSSKSSSKSKSKASRSRTTDGKVGTQEVAEHLGIEPRALRMVLRRLKIDKDDETQRYEWSSLNHPAVKKIKKAVEGGAVKREQRASLDKLKAKKAGAKRSKSSGTSSKKSSGTKRTSGTKKRRRSS